MVDLWLSIMASFKSTAAREDNPLGDLFPQRHDVPLAQVLETVDNHCSMLRAGKLLFERNSDADGEAFGCFAAAAVDDRVIILLCQLETQMQATG